LDFDGHWHAEENAQFFIHSFISLQIYLIEKEEFWKEEKANGRRNVMAFKLHIIFLNRLLDLMYF
jgi:hypothetical protein